MLMSSKWNFDSQTNQLCSRLFPCMQFMTVTSLKEEYFCVMSRMFITISIITKFLLKLRLLYWSVNLLTNFSFFSFFKTLFFIHFYLLFSWLCVIECCKSLNNRCNIFNVIWCFDGANSRDLKLKMWWRILSDYGEFYWCLNEL